GNDAITHLFQIGLEQLLGQMGYGVVAASDGAEAWRMFDMQPTRIVVSDWLMPEMDGLELCQKIRQRENTDYTYFIMLTANVGQEENYYQAMESGVDDFLSKPLDRHQLQIRLHVAERILMSTSRIQSLENVLTICAYTKRINFPDEGWQTIEEFLDKHLGIKLSHGVDPGYYESHIKPELEKMKRASRAPFEAGHTRTPFNKG
ncbi:MAG: response regulator, partial [Verrucomicrobiota bacterium]